LSVILDDYLIVRLTGQAKIKSWL